MDYVFEIDELTKRYASLTALDEITLSITPGHMIGLIGRNGSGKTTLIQHLIGLLLPTRGTCRTLGCDAAALGAEQLSRIGVVHQEARYIEWMSVQQHIRYVASFYKKWDREREEKLLDHLDRDAKAKVVNLSTGDAQKLGIILAVCHHPDLLLLDEPAAALDPIARVHLLEFLLELIGEDGSSVLISSHILRDIEQIVDWVLCLDRGKLLVDASLDELQEHFAAWQISSPEGNLPDHFDEGFVLSQTDTPFQAQILVRDAADHLDAFRRRHSAHVETSPLNLERIFPLLLEKTPAMELVP